MATGVSWARSLTFLQLHTIQDRDHPRDMGTYFKLIKTNDTEIFGWPIARATLTVPSGLIGGYSIGQNRYRTVPAPQKTILDNDS